MKPAIVALLSILVLSSCASGPKMNRLHEGMTKSEVLSAVGSPDGYQRSGEYEVLLYVDRNTTPGLFLEVIIAMSRIIQSSYKTAR